MTDTNKLMTELLETSIKRPKVLLRDKQTLSLEVEEVSEQIHELTNGDKVVITQTIETATTRIIVVREYDPSKSYSDAIKEFTQ